MHTNRKNIVVIGAGPAGSTAAFCLARLGLDVCLVDKQVFPRPKLCAGLLTWKTIELLKSVFGTSPGDLTAGGMITHTCRDYRIYAGHKEIGRGRLDFPFHFVDRTKYDLYWLEKARTAGAEVVTGVTAADICPDDGRILLSNGVALTARVIIGADGAWSRIRRTLFNNTRSHRQWRHQMAMTIEKRCAIEYPCDYAALHFGFVPWGYAWDFPSGVNRVVGMCGLRTKDDQPFKESFFRYLNSIDLEKQAGSPLQGHPLPFGNYLKTPGKGRVLLVGDACGLADPLLGEGIYYAHRSAQIASTAIGTNGLPPSRILDVYQRELRRHIIREFGWIKFYRNLLFAGGRIRKFRGLRLFLHLFPKRLEAAIQGQLPFRRLLVPDVRPEREP